MPGFFHAMRMTAVHLIARRLTGTAVAASALCLALTAPAPIRAQGFKYWDVEDTATIPKTLSEMRLFTTLTPGKEVLQPNAYRFDVNTALWSDGAHKTRWAMPKPGKSIGFLVDDDYWKYPDSTVFIKQFDIDTVPGDTTSRVRWETRILISKKEVSDSSVTPHRIMDHWYGYSYKWNKDQKDARLVPKGGLNDTLRVYPNGKSQPFVWKKWHFPKRSQCDECHRTTYADTVQGRAVLGFLTAQLNRPHPDSANINQLEFFFKKGLLTGAKPANWNAYDVPKWAGIDDNTASIDLRARSYIAANCSGCHGYRGMLTGATPGRDLDYDYFTMKERMEFRYHHVSWPFNLDADSVTPKYYPLTDRGNNPTGLDSFVINPALVVPGYPQKSVILYRQTSRNTAPFDWDEGGNQMPPLGSYEVNVTATNLISGWIKNWTPFPAPIPIAIRGHDTRTAPDGPAIRGNQVILPPEMAGPGNVSVSLTGIDGRRWDLMRLGGGVYALPRLTRGLYVIKVGGRSFTRHLF